MYARNMTHICFCIECARGLTVKNADERFLWPHTLHNKPTMEMTIMMRDDGPETTGPDQVRRRRADSRH